MRFRTHVSIAGEMSGALEHPAPGASFIRGEAIVHDIKPRSFDEKLAAGRIKC